MFSGLSASMIAVELERAFLLYLSGESSTSAAVGGNSNKNANCIYFFYCTKEL